LRIGKLQYSGRLINLFVPLLLTRLGLAVSPRLVLHLLAFITRTLPATMADPRIGEVFNFGTLHMEWPTALFVFVMFMITVTALNLLLYKPLLATLEARENADDGAGERLDSIEKELVALEDSYKQVLNTAHRANEAAHKVAVAEANAEAQVFITEAKERSAVTMESATREIESEIVTATAQAKELATGLAETIQTKVLAS